METSTVCCIISVCSCFIMISKFYIFSAVNGGRLGVVMVRRGATLPMSCYIVREITTRSVELWFNVSTEFSLCTSRNLWYLRVGTTKALVCGFGERPYCRLELKYSRYNRNKGNAQHCRIGVQRLRFPIPMSLLSFPFHVLHVTGKYMYSVYVLHERHAIWRAFLVGACTTLGA